MKTQKINRKLSLKKQTVADLDKQQQSAVLGGYVQKTVGATCITTCELVSCIHNATGCAPAVYTDCAFPSDDVYTCPLKTCWCQTMVPVPNQLGPA